MLIVASCKLLEPRDSTKPVSHQCPAPTVVFLLTFAQRQLQFALGHELASLKMCSL